MTIDLTLSRDQTLDRYNDIMLAAQAKGGNAPADILRELMQTDLFYLIVYGFGRTDVNREWLFDRCREVQARPDGMIDLWSRAHYKSSLITYALTIQDILNNPNLTFGIFSHTRPIAKGFLRQIKRELETNVRLQEFFPDILYQNPKADSPKWSEDSGIIVKRTSNPKEATIEAHGLVDGQPTSRHYDVMIYDDVVTRESVTTPEMIHKTTEAWQLSLNLAAEHGKKRIIGTRYNFNDTYKYILDNDIATPRIYAATEDGTPAGVPVLLTREQLKTKRKEMGNYVFSCQMLQNPVMDSSQGLDEAWLKYWTAMHYTNLNIYILCDPANSKKKTSDYTCYMVIGLGADRNFYIIDMIRDRLNLMERTNTLFALHRKFKPVGVGYEQVGMQADIQHYEDRMERDNYRFNIKPIPAKTPKNDRIQWLQPLFEDGRIYLPQNCIKADYEGKQWDMTKVFVNEEYKLFPVAVHEDMLDCLAKMVDPDFVTEFPISDAPKKVLTQAERDYAIITGQDPDNDNSSAFTIEG